MAVLGIIGKKVGMTQLFDSNGDVRPATVIQAGPCVVTQRKTASKDGYDAAQIGLVEFIKESKLNKAELGHLTKNSLPPVRIIREVGIEVAAAATDGDGDEHEGWRSRAGRYLRRREVRRYPGREQRPRIRRRSSPASFRGRREVARFDVPDPRIDWIFGIPVARVQRNAHVGSHGNR